MELFERFSGSPLNQELTDGVLPDGPPPAGVALSQIRTCNPHFHDDKGDEHVQSMRFQALNVLYHSPVCPPSLRTEILDFLILQGALEPGQEPARERIYPPVGTLELDRLYDGLTVEASSFHQFGQRVPRPPSTVVPDRREELPETALLG